MTGNKRLGRVFMMDMLAIVPYYTGYLSTALIEEGIDLQVGTITYYLDTDFFCSRGLRTRPGLLDIIGRIPTLPAGIRRAGKLMETAVNMVALFLRFVFQPPSVLHVQYLPLFRLPLRLDFLFAKAIQRRGARLVLTVHDVLPHDSGDQYRSEFEVLYRSADRLICHSDHIRTRLVEEFSLPENVIDIIPHGPLFYDVPADSSAGVRTKYGIGPEQQIVLWQGIILPYKGLDLLLEAWKFVESKKTSAVLVVIGTGAQDLLDGLRNQAKELGLKHVVFDLRFISSTDLVAVYKAASIVVYPYRAITTSGALATGIALGKAIIASDLPVFRELLTDGEDALLVPPGDVRALEEAIVQLLSDEAMRRQLELCVIQKEFGKRSWKAIAEKTVKSYEAALCQPSA